MDQHQTRIPFEKEHSRADYKKPQAAADLQPARGRLVTQDQSDISLDARRQAVSIVQLGCDRSTAARFLGISLEQFNRAAESEADFGLDLARAEAAAELAHMRCVQLAAQDPKNWRTSVWWLERMRPEVYKPRKPAAIRKVAKNGR